MKKQSSMTLNLLFKKLVSFDKINPNLCSFYLVYLVSISFWLCNHSVLFSVLKLRYGYLALVGKLIKRNVTLCRRQNNR